MSKEVLKTAYIDFQAKGVQEIRTLITHLGRDLDKFSASIGQSQLKMASKLGDISNKIKESAKKANEAVLVGTKASTAALGREVSALKLINKEFRGLASTSKELRGLGGRLSVRITQKSPELLRVEAAEKAAKIEEKAAKEAAREKIRAAKEAARQEREGERRRREFANNIASSIGLVARFASAFGRDYMNRMSMRAENIRYENLLKLSGTENARARNYGVRMVSLGGTTEGALGTLNALSSSLGGIARGDTGLLQTLGMYGISGISARTSPEELINKIRDRIQRGDLSKNEINALLSQLPFDDAQKRAIMSSRADLFSGELGTFSVDERNIDALYKNAEMTENLRTSIDNALGVMSNVDNGITSAINSISGLVGKLAVNSEAIKELTDLLTKNLPELLKLLGGLGGGGLSAAAAGAGGFMGALLTKAKTVGRTGWNALKWVGRFATIPAAVGATAVGGTAATTYEFVERMRKNPVQENWGTGVGDNLKIQRLANRLMTPTVDGGYDMMRIEKFNQKYGGQIPIWDRFYSKLHSENSNSNTVNNYYINYNSPQQETSIPFYLAARNQNGRMWEEDSIYNFSY